MVAGLVGEPKETHDFTKNLVSLTLSHVKVELDLPKPPPDIVEFTRESGEFVEVTVTYPWLPPTCSHCKELCHIANNCLLLPISQKTNSTPKQNPIPRPPSKIYVPKQQSKSNNPPTPFINNPNPNPPSIPAIPSQTASPTSDLPSSSSATPPLPLNYFHPLPSSTPEKNVTTVAPSSKPLPVLPDFRIDTSPPNPRLGLSLKRSCSDPTLSPPHSSFLPPLPASTTQIYNRNPIAPLLLSPPIQPDPNRFSNLVPDSSSQGESPPF